jgi:hypothetical protein
MKENYKLYMVLLGCTPKGRLTEQHDIFFGIGTSIKDLVPDMYAFWPDGGELHVDSWREVTYVDGHAITIAPKGETKEENKHLFFINLGGYKPGELEEYHYKTLIAADSMATAVKESKKSAFYKHVGFKGAASHIDDKYGIDVDDMFKVQDILAPHLKERYSIVITPAEAVTEDELHIGYLKLGKFR